MPRAGAPATVLILRAAHAPAHKAWPRARPTSQMHRLDSSISAPPCALRSHAPELDAPGAARRSEQEIRTARRPTAYTASAQGGSLVPAAQTRSVRTRTRDRLAVVRTRPCRADTRFCFDLRELAVNPVRREEIFRRLKALNPAPRTELEYRTPFELLVAVVLSAQATDKSVNLATRRLFSVANSPATMLALGEDGLVGYIKSIGLYRSKARNLIATCRVLLERHGGDVPAEREALENLPGVGRKTANVVLNTAFGEATIAVDTHIFRVSNRTGLAPGKNVAEVERKLMKLVPQEYKKDAHHWLILHGRYLCKARKPDCGRCPIADLCDYPAKTHAAARPAARRSARA